MARFAANMEQQTQIDALNKERDNWKTILEDFGERLNQSKKEVEILDSANILLGNRLKVLKRENERYKKLLRLAAEHIDNGLVRQEIEQTLGEK